MERLTPGQTTRLANAADEAANTDAGPPGGMRQQAALFVQAFDAAAAVAASTVDGVSEGAALGRSVAAFEQALGYNEAATLEAIYAQNARLLARPPIDMPPTQPMIEAQKQAWRDTRPSAGEGLEFLFEAARKIAESTGRAAEGTTKAVLAAARANKFEVVDPDEPLHVIPPLSVTVDHAATRAELLKWLRPPRPDSYGLRADAEMEPATAAPDQLDATRFVDTANDGVPPARTRRLTPAERKKRENGFLKAALDAGIDPRNNRGMDKLAESLGLSRQYVTQQVRAAWDRMNAGEDCSPAQPPDWLNALKTPLR